VSRVAIVTGGASGIGRGVAHAFAAASHAVAVLDIDADGAERVAAEVTARGARALAVHADVASWDAVGDAVARVRSDLGAPTILVTSAGISMNHPVADIPRDVWDRILAVNLTGTFTCIHTVLPDMRAAGWGRIVTISSAAAQIGSPGQVHYAATKGGVIGLTKALAREVAREGITVNTIPPALVDTPMSRATAARGHIDVDKAGAMTPVGRAGTPEDIAAMCAFLCSDAAAYITGQVIGVNGGVYS
jgi:NAD(P)-dependent dehydrogenase (short-subunit alcohol dehydrogenase family)